MKRKFFPTTHVEVTSRQPLTKDIFGMGNFYEPHDFYGQKNVRGPAVRHRIVKRAIAKIAGEKNRQILAKTRKVLADKLVRRKAPATVKLLAARALDVEAREKGMPPLPSRAAALVQMIPPKLYRSLRSGPKSDVMRLMPAGQQTYFVPSYGPVLRSEQQKPKPFSRYNRAGMLVPGITQDYVDPASITTQTDAFQRTATQVVPARTQPSGTFFGHEIPASWFAKQPSVTRFGASPIVPKDGGGGIGEPKRTTVIHERRTDLAKIIDARIRPKQVIEYEELGWPYKVGEAQRYAGMTKEPGASIPVDPSVIRGASWQSPAFAWKNFSSDPLKNNPDPDAGMSGMGEWPLGTSGLAWDIMDRIGVLETAIEKASPSVMSTLDSKYVTQRATIKALFKDVDESPAAGLVEIAKAATWMATAKYYLGKLEDRYDDLKKAGQLQPSAADTAARQVGEDERVAVRNTALAVGIPLALGTLVLGYVLLRKKGKRGKRGR